MWREVGVMFQLSSSGSRSASLRKDVAASLLLMQPVLDTIQLIFLIKAVDSCGPIC